MRSTDVRLMSATGERLVQTSEEFAARDNAARWAANRRRRLETTQERAVRLLLQICYAAQLGDPELASALRSH